MKRFSLFISFIIAFLAFTAVDNSPEEERPNIVMISLDTLRADHMQCFGYEKNTTPFMCNYGEENIIFESAFAQAPWTLPSQTSTFTSKYPSVHNTTSNNRIVAKDSTTLAEILNESGYDTAAFVTGNYTQGQGSKPVGHYLPRYGLDKGFSEYEVEGMHINDTFSTGLKWLETREEDKPFFLFLQGYDIHGYGLHETQNRFRENTTGFFSGRHFSPYGIEKENGTWTYSTGWLNRSINLSDEDLDQLNEVYNANLYRTDSDLKMLFQRLKDRDEYENTIVVIYSAHGTNLNDRVVRNKRITGHTSLRDYNLHTPLIMRIPGEENRRIKDKVGLIDLTPTLIDLSNSDTGERMQGESLVSLINGNSGGKKYVYSESNQRDSIRGDRWRLITGPSTGKTSRTQLVNLDTGKTTAETSVNRTRKTEDLMEEIQSWRLNNLKNN